MTKFRIWTAEPGWGAEAGFSRFGAFFQGFFEKLSCDIENRLPTIYLYTFGLAKTHKTSAVPAL